MTLKKIVYTLILLTLIVLKVSSAALHIHLHHGHNDNHEDSCELCEYAINHQNIEFSLPVELQFVKDNKEFVFDRQNNFYKDVYLITFFEDVIFVRPPPILV